MSGSPEGRSYLPPEETLFHISGLATASLVMGVIGWSLLPFLGGIAAIVLGHMARLAIARSEDRLTGDKIAITGLIMGYANIVFTAVITVCIASLFLLPVLEKILSP